MSWLKTVLIGRKPKRTLVRLIILIALAVLVRAYVLLPIEVHNISMLPTHGENQRNFVNRAAYLFSEPERGDVVAIRLAGTRLMYMKRIVALPGETVAFEKGRLLVNGETIEEPYVKLPCDWVRDPVTVGVNEFFVVGDNRSMPIGDHEFGRTDRARIVGKILLCKSRSGPWLGWF